MKKNKFLTAFAMTMLGSCVGFSSEFKDGYDLPAVTPKKVEREIREVVIGEDTINVTPITERRIAEVQAGLLTTPQIKTKVEASLADKRMHRTVYDLALQYGIEEEQEAREAENEGLRQMALKKQAEIAQEDARFSMLLSVRKHTKESAEQVSALTKALESYQLAKSEQDRLSQDLASQVEELQSQIDQSNELFESEKAELNLRIASESEKADALEQCNLLHMGKIQKMKDQLAGVQREKRETDARNQSLELEMSLLNERLQSQRVLTQNSQAALSDIIPKFSLSALDSVIDRDEEKSEPLVVARVLNGTTNNSSEIAAVTTTEQKPKKKVGIRKKTDLNADEELDA